MEIANKAQIRIKHWMEHNDSHILEYEAFAKYLEESGKSASSTHILEMVELTRKTGECLRKALLALDKPKP